MSNVGLLSEDTDGVCVRKVNTHTDTDEMTVMEDCCADKSFVEVEVHTSECYCVRHEF